MSGDEPVGGGGHNDVVDRETDALGIHITGSEDIKELASDLELAVHNAWVDLRDPDWRDEPKLGYEVSVDIEVRERRYHDGV